MTTEVLRALKPDRWQLATVVALLGTSIEALDAYLLMQANNTAFDLFRPPAPPGTGFNAIMQILVLGMWTAMTRMLQLRNPVGVSWALWLGGIGAFFSLISVDLVPFALGGLLVVTVWPLPRPERRIRR